MSVAVDASFAPDAARALRLDAEVRQGLVESLTAVLAALNLRGENVEALLRRIAAGRVAPALVGTYVELVLAVFDERMDEANTLAASLLARRDQHTATLICTLDDAALGPGEADRYQRLLAKDIACGIAALEPEAVREGRDIVEAALALLSKAAPDIHDEIRGLLCEFVLVRPRAPPGGFGGASVFSLWGAVVLNAEAFPGRLSMALQLAHEAAHTLLFGLALGGRITENDETDRYASPLRRDQRPMEGVAHATFVSARMLLLLDQLLDSEMLTQAERSWAEDERRQLERGLSAGLDTVAGQARLNEVGDAAFAGVRAFMTERSAAAQ